MSLYLKAHDLIVGSLWNVLNRGRSDSFPPTWRRGHCISVLLKPVKNGLFSGPENEGWYIMFVNNIVSHILLSVICTMS